jgi:hypothetical protein
MRKRDPLQLDLFRHPTPQGVWTLAETRQILHRTQVMLLNTSAPPMISPSWRIWRCRCERTSDYGGGAFESAQDAGALSLGAAAASNREAIPSMKRAAQNRCPLSRA